MGRRARSGSTAVFPRIGGRTGSRPRRRVLRWLVFLLLAGMILGAAGAGGIYLYVAADPDLPRMNSVADYHPRRVTHVLAADGRLIGELFVERRTVVAFDRFPKVLVDAVVAAEDAEFFRHQGLDYMGMLRAFVANLRAGHFVQGGSTITQQIIKGLLLSPERTLRRKLQEVILARRLEQSLSKQEILYLYLNQIYYGHGRYGVEEASRFYFGKGVETLNLGEAALLAGLPQGPELNSPIKHPERARARRRYVLEQMARQGLIASEVAARIAAEPFRIVAAASPLLDSAPEFVDVVDALLQEKYGRERLSTLGLGVRTTVVPELQAAARAALERGLEELDGRQGFRGPLARMKPPQAQRTLARLRQELGDGPRPGKIYEAVVVEVSQEGKTLKLDLGGRHGLVTLEGESRYNLPERPQWPQRSQRRRREPPIAAGPRFAVGDLLRVSTSETKPAAKNGLWALQLELGPQGAMVVVDPETRHVLAMVGGYGFVQGGFNRALRAHRQPGSAFKPLVYVTALRSRRFTPATLINDTPEVFNLWKPQNYEKEEYRGPVRLRVALAESINTVAIKLLSEVQVPPVIEVARSLGIASPLADDLSLALGSSAVTPLELCNAYATFAAAGKFSEPVFVTEIGNEKVPPPATSQVLDADVAFLITSMMRSVVEEGTARAAATRLKRPAAGKTGTSNAQRDAWFVGFTPDLVAGVWVGFDDMKKLGHREAGGRAALPVWIDFMLQALRERPVRPFQQPPGVVVARIDPATGKLSPPDSETGIEEVFLEGSAPTQEAPGPGEVDPGSFLIDQVGGQPGGQPSRSSGSPPATERERAGGAPVRPAPTAEPDPTSL